MISSAQSSNRAGNRVEAIIKVPAHQMVSRYDRVTDAVPIPKTACIYCVFKRSANVIDIGKATRINIMGNLFPIAITCEFTISPKQPAGSSRFKIVGNILQKQRLLLVTQSTANLFIASVLTFTLVTSGAAVNSISIFFIFLYSLHIFSSV
jgi:hypothetical protein